MAVHFHIETPFETLFKQTQSGIFHINLITLAFLTLPQYFQESNGIEYICIELSCVARYLLS